MKMMTMTVLNQSLNRKLRNALNVVLVLAQLILTKILSRNPNRRQMKLLVADFITAD